MVSAATIQKTVVLNIMAQFLGFEKTSKKIKKLVNAATVKPKKGDAYGGAKAYKDLRAEMDKTAALKIRNDKAAAGGTGAAQRLVSQVSNKINKGVAEENALRKENIGISQKYNSAWKNLRMPFDEWKKLNKEGEHFTSRGAKTMNRVRMLAHGMRGFRMALLGVMFAGQNLNKSMMKLLQPAMQAREITQKWAKGMESLFLPIIKAIEPVIEKLVDLFEDMPKGLKLVIGGFVLFTAVVGKIMFLIGSFGLAIGSVIMMMGKTPIVTAAAANGYKKVGKEAIKTTAANIALAKSQNAVNKSMAKGALTKGGGGLLSSMGKTGSVSGNLLGGGLFVGIIAGVKAAGAAFLTFISSPITLTILAIVAVVAALVGLYYLISKTIKGENKLAKSTKKTEKAFKGSGLHAAVLATREQFVKFGKDLQHTDFLLKISGKDVEGYESIWDKAWTGIKEIWDQMTVGMDIIIAKIKEFLGLDTEKKITVKTEYKNYVPPEDVQDLTTGSINEQADKIEEIERNLKPFERFASPSIVAAAGNKGLISPFFLNLPTPSDESFGNVTVPYGGGGGNQSREVSYADDGLFRPDNLVEQSVFVNVSIDGADIPSQVSQDVSDSYYNEGGF